MKFFKKIWNIIFPYRYESEYLLRNYIRSQYGPFLIEKPYYKSEDFYQKILAEAKPYIKNGMKILDVGCATGRISFELSNISDVDCTGTDLSKKFIDFTNKLKNGVIREINFPKQKPKIINFFTDDILDTKLKNNYFDFIVCVNIFDRVQNPPKLFDVLYGLLKNNGVLLIVDPYDWSMSSAPKKLQSNNMKDFLPNTLWTLEKELKDINYTVPINNKENRSYNCHLLVARKI